MTARCRVECRAGAPGAGHFSRRGLQAREHSASIRAGTVADGQNQQVGTKLPHRDHRGWSPHTVALCDNAAKPNQGQDGNFVTSGEIGTNVMHPPGERSIGINKCRFRRETRGRTQRSVPTRRFVLWFVATNVMVSIGDGRPTCPHHATNQRSRTKYQTGFS